MLLVIIAPIYRHSICCGYALLHETRRHKISAKCIMHDRLVANGVTCRCSLATQEANGTLLLW